MVQTHSGALKMTYLLTSGKKQNTSSTSTLVTVRFFSSRRSEVLKSRNDGTSSLQVVFREKLIDSVEVHGPLTTATVAFRPRYPGFAMSSTTVNVQHSGRSLAQYI